VGRALAVHRVSAEARSGKIPNQNPPCSLKRKLPEAPRSELRKMKHQSINLPPWAGKSARVRLSGVPQVRVNEEKACFHRGEVGRADIVCLERK